MDGDIPLGALGLSPRPHNALVRAGIDTVAKLVEAVRADSVLSVRNIGVTSVAEIETKLIEFGALDMYPAPLDKRELTVEERIEQAREQTKTEIMSRHVDAQLSLIRTHVEAGILHPGVVVFGVSVGGLLARADDLSLGDMASLASTVLSSVNLAAELQALFSAVPRAELRTILLPRYGLRAQTLQTIGDSLGLSRERIRQLETRIARNLSARAASLSRSSRLGHDGSGSALVKGQTALNIARDMARDISYVEWKQRLDQSGVSGLWSADEYADIDVVEAFVATCRILGKAGVIELLLPDNLRQALHLASDGRPNAVVRRSYPTADQRRTRRRIWQHLRHTGAVNARWLSQDLGVDAIAIDAELAWLGFIRIDGDWYGAPSSPDGPTIGHLEVLHRAICKMSLYCGPLDIQSLCGGIRKANFRKQFPVPPPDIMGRILTGNGYACEEGLYWWDGSISVELSASESVILRAFRTNGPVLNHAELAEAIRAAGLSFPALHSVLKHSPLFRRVEPGLYVVRGTIPTLDDLDRARGASQDVPLNLEVRYEAGCVVASMNVSVISLVAGTIAITSQDFPNLCGEWTCMAGDEASYKVRVTERGIAGLRFISEALGVQPGDRIALTFNPRLHTVTICLEERAQPW